MTSPEPLVVTRSVESFWDKALHIAQDIAEALETIGSVLESIDSTLQDASSDADS